jgi:hypothetical protein
MSNVWKRLQRVGKKAAKFNIKTYEHNLTIECSPKWQPNKVTIIFAHRDRRKSSKVCVCFFVVVVVLDTVYQLFFLFFQKATKWEPENFKNIYEGTCTWSKNDVIDFNVTLYRASSDEKYENKEWSILIEDVRTKKKKS